MKLRLLTCHSSLAVQPMDGYWSRPRDWRPLLQGTRELNHLSGDAAPFELIAERAQQTQVSTEWSPALLITLWACLVLGGRHRSPAIRWARGGDTEVLPQGGPERRETPGAEPKSLQVTSLALSPTGLPNPPQVLQDIDPTILETKVLTKAGLLYLYCYFHSSRVGPHQLSPNFDICAQVTSSRSFLRQDVKPA